MIGNSGIDQDVQAKMNAYRGNPQALAQQYQQGQQLIDLLALQKLKSEKESAAREMQLKMGGQQMPTVGQALESEVLDLTKQELAQNTAGAMQTKQNQEQQAAKQLVQRTAQMPMQSPSPMMQGVAGLPASNMSTQAMAGGGIVAFSGEDESYVDPLAGVSGMGREDIGRDRERLERVRQEQQRRRAEIRDYDTQAGVIRSAPPVSTSQAQAQDNETGPGQQSTLPRAEPRPEDRAAAPRAASQGQPGIAGLDPRAIAIRDQYQSYVGLRPEELQRREQNRAAGVSFDEERYSPERRQRGALTRFLLGGANRSGIGSIMAGAGAASENYKEGMDAQQRNAISNLQKLDDEATKTDVGIRKFAFDAGIKTATDYAQIAAQQASTALNRESMNQNKAFTILGTLEGRFNESVKLADANYNNKLKNIGIFPGQQPTPAQQQQLKIAQEERQADILGAQQRLGPLIQQASVKAGIPTAGAASGFSLQSVTPAATR